MFSCTRTGFLQDLHAWQTMSHQAYAQTTTSGPPSPGSDGWGDKTRTAISLHSARVGSYGYGRAKTEFVHEAKTDRYRDEKSRGKRAGRRGRESQPHALSRHPTPRAGDMPRGMRKQRSGADSHTRPKKEGSGDNLPWCRLEQPKAESGGTAG